MSASSSEEQAVDPSLKRRFDRYAELLDGMREAFMVLDHDFRVVEMNALGLRLASRPFDELRGRTHWELWPASLGTPVEAAYRRVMTHRVPVSLRHHYTSGEHDYWLEIKAYPVSDGVAVLYREVTPIVQGESSLRQSEARFRAAISAVGVMWTNDAAGKMKGKQTGWAELTGQAEAEYQDYGWASAVHPDDAQPTIEAWNLAVAGKRTFEFEHRVRRRDGQWRNFSVRAVPVIEDGSIQEWIGVHIDITAQSKAIHELTASELRSQTILESITDGFFTLDREWRFDYVNPEAERILDCKPGALLGRVIWEAYPGSLGNEFEQTYRRVAAQNKPESFLAFYPDHGRWYDVRAFPLQTGVSVYFRDVTAAKQTEAALRASEGRRRLALESAELGAWNIDLHRRLLTADERFFTIFSGATAPLSYDQAVAAVHAADRSRVGKAIAAATRTNDPAPYAIEYRVVHPDGAVRWVFAKGGANFAGEGAERHLTSFDGTIADISERKIIEERLQLSEARFRTLFNSIDEGFCVIEVMFDAAGVAHDYRFLEANPAFSRHNGLHDAIGKTMRDFAPDMDPIFFEIYGRVVTTGEPIRFESESTALHRWFDVYAFRLGDAPDRKVAVLFTDISSRRRAEQDLQRVAAELSEADRRKDEFLATLAHELRNPLAPIRNGLQLMRLSNYAEATTRKAAGVMDRQVTQMVRLVDDLLDVSRISRDKLQLQKERVSLSAVLAQAAETSRPLISASGHEFVALLLPEEIVLDADLTRLVQVFSNLLNNAAKFSPKSSRIVLSARAAGDDVVVSVKDNGMGIPRGMLPKVFDMFTQVGGSMERSQGGLGIGLTLVKRLTELHGGSVEARSDGEGKGSEFVVRLPRAPSTGSVTDIETPAPGLSSQLKVLVADDNADAAETLVEILKMMGHAVQLASDGREAVASAAAFEPDVIVLDIGMPHLNGYEACRLIRAQPSGKKPLILALTGWGQEGDKRLSKDAGFDHHLVKPIDPAFLGKVLDDAQKSVRAGFDAEHDSPTRRHRS